MAPAPPPASTPAPPAVAAAEPPAAEEKPTPASEDAAYLSMKEMIKAGNAPAAREAAAMFYRRYPRSHMSERVEHLTGARPGAETFRGPRRPMPTRMEPVLRPGGRQ